MSVVLLILKILGILLLVLLGLLVLILLTLLFAPVRYRIRGSTKPELSVTAVIRWLFPLISLRIAFEGKEVTQSLRILGIPISLGGRKEKNGTEPGSKAPKKPEKPEDGYVGSSERPDSQPEEQAAAGSDDWTGIEEAASGIGSEEAASEKGGGEAAFEGSSGRGRNFFQKVKSLPRMIKKKVAKLKETALRIWTEFRNEANRNVVRILFGELRRLLGHYLPGKLKAEAAFGMADPAVTGRILGVLSLFPVMLQPQVRITPDFMADKMYITGSFDMRGHVRAVHAAASVLRIWREPDVKNLIKRVRNRR